MFKIGDRVRLVDNSGMSEPIGSLHIVERISKASPPRSTGCKWVIYLKSLQGNKYADRFVLDDNYVVDKLLEDYYAEG